MDADELKEEIEMVDRAGLADAIEEHAAQAEGDAFITYCSRAEWHVIIAALRGQ